MPFCEECQRDFGKYETVGKCPLCGVWAKIECSHCGRTADAKQYIDAGKKCPKCGTKAAIPGTQSLLVPAGLAAVLVAFVVYIVIRFMSVE